MNDAQKKLRNEVLNAIDAADWNAKRMDWTPIARVGWQGQADFLNNCAAKNGIDKQELRAWALAYGGEDPAIVLEATAAYVADPATKSFRPAPSDVKGYLPQAEPTAIKDRRLRPDQEPEALAEVIELRAAGERGCNCENAAVNLTSKNGVLRCRDCGGLEIGQMEYAQEMAA